MSAVPASPASSGSPEPDRRELVDKLRIDRSAAGAAPRRSRIRNRAVATAVVAALLLAALLALFGRGEVPEVKTAVARAAGEMPADTSVLDASGYVVARRQATVSAKITGKVVEVLIEEGMHVDENAVMARLDDTEAKAQLDLARAQLDAARASLDVFTADEHQAERDFARQQALAAAKATSTQEEEQAGAARDTLRARVENAKEQIKVAEQSVDVAKVQLDNTEVRAPFAGVVVAKAAQPGEMISPISAGGGFTRTGIGTIVDMDSLEIEVDVNESFINRVSAGQPVQATLNAYPDWKIPGKVIAVVPTADRNKATIKVRVAIDVKDPRIVPEMGVRVAFLSTASPGSRTGVWVPNEAVVSPAGRPAVFVYEKGAVTRKDVTLGESTQADRQVTGGLAAGQHVVLSPPPSLENGAAVHATD